MWKSHMDNEHSGHSAICLLNCPSAQNHWKSFQSFDCFLQPWQTYLVWFNPSPHSTGKGVRHASSCSQCSTGMAAPMSTVTAWAKMAYNALSLETARVIMTAIICIAFLNRWKTRHTVKPNPLKKTIYLFTSYHSMSIHLYMLLAWPDYCLLKKILGTERRLLSRWKHLKPLWTRRLWPETMPTHDESRVDVVHKTVIVKSVFESNHTTQR